MKLFGSQLKDALKDALKEALGLGAPKMPEPSESARGAARPGEASAQPATFSPEPYVPIRPAA